MTVLVTGARGNLASQIIEGLIDKGDTVVALDLTAFEREGVASVVADITDGDRVEAVLAEHRPERIIHMASLLSTSSEANRELAVRVNLDASIALMELAVKHGVDRFFYPSTGATYGGVLPDPLPEYFPQWPTNIYGVTKVAVERAGSYFAARGELDFRSLRLPMVISPSAPAGAVSAYASHAFRAAATGESFVFPVSEEVGISTIYIADVVSGILQVLDAPSDQLTQRVYNVHSFSPTAGDIARVLTDRVAGFSYRFEPQEENMRVLSGLPSVHLDGSARADWGWSPSFQLDACADDMLARIRAGA